MRTIAYFYFWRLYKRLARKKIENCINYLCAEVERCAGSQVVWKGDGQCYNLGER